MANWSARIMIASVIWRLIKPVVEAVAASTKNTSIDDTLVVAIDQIFSSNVSDFDDVLPSSKNRRVRDAVSEVNKQGTQQEAVCEDKQAGSNE